MDDELKAIQADLESVLDRLADYMSSDKLTSDYAEPQPSDREDAARVALRHVATRSPSLESSIHAARYVREGRPADLYAEGTMLRDHPEDSEELAELMAALRALDGWLIDQWPLEDEHLQTLALAVSAWSDKEGQFIGENAGLTLTPKCKLDRRKLARESAAFDAWSLHASDPQANPIDETLFERAGKPYGMSASVVKRAYYSEDARALREAFGPGKPRPWDKEGSLEAWVTKRWSETDEN
ncbi:hypothetical protein [Halomonas sp. 3H]|uniref:hypothetical protein n=1 Tax=Halomonas sp. 3H TaxID=2952527 RepID=UPI0020B85E3F|nr:hypothetical protein [Halomonas sp. 3H]